MWFLHRSSAIVLWLIVGIAGFMIYHKQTNLPLADVLSTQNAVVSWDITYQIYGDHIILSNSLSVIVGTLKIPISYDSNSVKFLTDQITSPYEYSFDSAQNGMITLFIDGTIKPGTIVTIPLQWDSSNISIASPILVSDDSSSSLSLTRIE